MITAYWASGHGKKSRRITHNGMFSFPYICFIHSSKSLNVMKQSSISRLRNIWSLTLIIGLSFSLHSCAQESNPDAGSAGCLDTKPDPTPFSNTLNAINHTIPIQTAMAMVNHFDSVRIEMGTRAGYTANTLPVFETFNLQAVQTLICQPNTVGFRIYLAMDNQQNVRYVLVGVDGDGKDIIQRVRANPGMDIGHAGDLSVLLMEAGQRWP
jgi:hypothetical protein